MLAFYCVFVVLTFGTAFAEDPCDFQHWRCEGNKATFEPIGDLEIFNFDTKVDVRFSKAIEEVEIKTAKAKIDLIGVGGPSLKKITIQVNGIALHNLCDILGPSKVTTFEVNIDGAVGKLSQNQRCHGHHGRKITLEISKSLLQVNNHDEYDSEADLTFDSKVFNPITLDNVTVYNTRRIAFDHYSKGGVKIFEPIRLPSVGDEMCNSQRATPNKLKLCQDNYVKPADSSVAVYPNDRDRFQMRDAPPTSAGMRPRDFKELLIVGILATAGFLNL